MAPFLPWQLDADVAAAAEAEAARRRHSTPAGGAAASWLKLGHELGLLQVIPHAALV